MSYYRAHHREAVDDDSLEALRDRCAAVLRDALPAPARDLPLAEIRAALLAGLRFRAFPDALPTVDALLAAGHQLAIVSNWDVSLHAVLRDTGLASRVSVVVTSAEEGVAKPDARIFERALQLLGGISAVDALHVGDDLHGDVSGALAAGLQAVWIDRTGGSAGQAPAGARTVQSLLELVR